jgi:hypothetical protein
MMHQGRHNQIGSFIFPEWSMSVFNCLRSYERRGSILIPRLRGPTVPQVVVYFTFHFASYNICEERVYPWIGQPICFRDVTDKGKSGDTEVCKLHLGRENRAALPKLLEPKHKIR